MESVFVAFSPYHVFLSCAIALDQGDSADNYLFAVCNFKENRT